MKAINWVILGISFAFSLFFLWLYFLLGFNLIDWPNGIVLTVLWWAAIAAVIAGLVLQGKHFEKSRGTTSKENAGGTSPTKQASKGTSAPSAVSCLVVALLVPALVFSPYFPTNLSYADTSKEADAKAAASPAASASSALPTSEKDAVDPDQTAGPQARAIMYNYKLSANSQGVDVFYSINGQALKQLEPGESISTYGTWSVEFFVRPQVGYLTDPLFLHSASATEFITPDQQGTYARIGTNELPGFSAALDQALELGCTKEFHFSVNLPEVSYRQFELTAAPFAVTAVFDLNGGTLDGSSSYQDGHVYYGANVAGHQDQNIIQLPSAAPTKAGHAFKGWVVADAETLEPAGGQVNIDDFWRYLYDNPTSTSGGVLPIKAIWEEATDEPPAVTEPDTDGDGSSTTEPDTDGDGSSTTEPDDEGEGPSATEPDTGGEGSSATETETETEEVESSTTESTEPGNSDDNSSAGPSTGTSGSGADNNGSSAGSAGGSGPDNTGASAGGSSPSSSGSSSSSGAFSPMGTEDSPGGGTSGAQPGAGSSSSSLPSQGSTAANTNKEPASGSGSAAGAADMGTADNNKKPQTPNASNVLSGNKNHTMEMAGHQWNVGVLPEGTPLAGVLDPTIDALRNDIYLAEDAVSGTPLTGTSGLSYANRGCWVCDYLIAGIILTLLYGGGTMIVRSARRRPTQK